MKRLGLILAALLCILQGSRAAGAYQMRSFIGYDTSDGLPNNWIKKVVQDKAGYIWVATNEGLCRFDGNGFHVPSFISSSKDINRDINDLYVDDDNILWISTDEALLYVNLGTYESSTIRTGVRAASMAKDKHGNLWCILDNVVVKYATDHTWKEYPDFKGRMLCATPSGQIWATSREGALLYYEPSDDLFRQTPICQPPADNSGFSTLSCLDERTLLLTTRDNHVFVLDTATGRGEEIFDSRRDADGALILSATRFSADEYLIATDNGLYSVADGKKSDRLSFEVPGGRPVYNLRCLFKDNEDRVWIGTFFDGLCCSYLSSVVQFTRDPSSFRGTLAGEVVRSMCEDKLGNVWAATENGTVEKICPDGSVFSYTSSDGFPVNANFQAICTHESLIYIGSYGMGVYVFDPDKEKILKHYDVGGNKCAKMLCGKDGTVFVGTSDGLYRKRPGMKDFEKVESVGAGFVHALCFDARGNVWVGFYRGGLMRLRPLNDEVLAVSAHTMENPLGSLRITDIMESADGKIWATTEGDGLFILSEDAKGDFEFTSLKKEDGLPSDIACSVAEDSYGNIWLTTIGGVVMIKDDLSIIRMPEFRKGLSQFRYGAVLKTSSGKVFFGTTHGAFCFDPESVRRACHRLEIADAYRANRDGDYPLNVEGPITLSYADASLTIRLTNHKSNLGEICQFEYSLSSKNNRRYASLVTKDNSITYANLEAGTYVFTAKVIGDADPTQCVTRMITVQPPFYTSAGAKAIYGFFAAAIMVLLILYFHRKYKMRAARETEILEMEKQREVYESKLSFFTNISHEIRTPLTLIKIPVEKMMANHSFPTESEEDMMIVKTNTDRLLSMVNQFLDLRKYEGWSRDLHFSEVDFVELLKETCKEFSCIADGVGVVFSYSLPDQPALVNCSRSSAGKILGNLFMNAVKYCSKNVNVSLTVDKDTLSVVVDSDGALIPAFEREKIFEPFYQSMTRTSNVSSTKGSGIGLALSKSLAAMQGGDIVLDISRTDCNSFVFTLPFERKEDKEQPEELSHAAGHTIDGEDDSSDRFSVLVVEDDRELNKLLVKELSSEYHVLHSYNGREAVKILQSATIGLVVSDVIMPEMDGCALCDFIKNNVEFSHIPVVLITAATGSDIQLSSLQSGADYYLPKPFSMDVLKASIFNILKNREIINRRFASKPFNMETAASGTRDEEFMAKLNSIVMDNLSDPQFSVFDLADQMSVSRSTLFRKIKANTGQNVNEYIKICRLKKATELLASNRYMIKEISYMVGFSSSSYFAKEFKNQFGISPSSITSVTDN